MLKQSEAMKQAVEFMTYVYSKDYYQAEWVGDKIVVSFTDDINNSLFDTYGYFMEAHDNDDVLDTVLRDFCPKLSDEEINQVYFYVCLIREDYENTKQTSMPSQEESYIVNKVQVHFDTNNLTPKYIQWAKENRKRLHALLAGGYYTDFVS